ncbi:S-layer homology domain-containing protein [Paenibacillus sp. 276b]|uniref:S-layer homology domain-containing protein n=1 Tax=Paenibacillus sp. 276b TaxID=1566277 RepID=UPI00089779BA|nr:S-layer homology domain-containing protein [Paenibacillus sp. 276b]SEB17503.1 S-layer homology domain-containing protein [Paenibacillus sp. 276b]
MQQKKRPLAWIMLVAMVFSLFPQGLFGGAVASAADGDGTGSNAYSTYFTPDIKVLRETSILSLVSGQTGKEFLSRSNAYTTSTSTISISGSYAFVSKDTMKVKVEQLNSTTEGSVNKWVPDETKSITTAVTADSSGNNKFNANNLTLFPGFNKITFLGVQGSVERSDTFYVLYDQAPYIENFKISTVVSGGTGNATYDLNAGSETVVNTERVSIQGKVQNATQVTVTVNGSDSFDSAMLQDGSFFLPQLKLKAGINTLKFKISSASNSIETERSVYYFDKNQPFTKLDLTVGTETQSILNDANPNFTIVGQTEGKLSGQALLPYSASSSDFSPTNGTITLSNSNIAQPTTFTFHVTKTTAIAGADGISLEYRLVDFVVDTPFKMELEEGGTDVKKNQEVKVSLTYGNFSTGFTGGYVYSPGSQDILNMYYLPDYKSGPIESKTKLDGSRVKSDTFFILVESSKDINAATLFGEYLPTGVNKLKIDAVPTVPAMGLTTKQQIYQITGFVSGEQQIRFYFGKPTDLPKVVKISYSSVSSIYVENLQDGQTYSFDSKSTEQTMSVKGKFIGFKTLGIDFKPELVVNGKVLKDTEYTKVSTGFPDSNGDFSIKLKVLKEGPIVYGENTIVIRAIDEDANKQPTTITTTLRINVIDTNQSTVTTFMPTLVPKDSRQPFVDKALTSYTQDELKKIFAVTPEFAFKEDKYVTSEENYDLVINGGGAQIANVYFGSKLVFTHTQATDRVLQTNKLGENGMPTFDFVGNENQFFVRIQNLKFDAPGTHVYTLELINRTGARTTQRLEIVREPSSYRILAPQPTVGDKIVVNKNFVRFDIEAEGATQVLIDKQPAVKRTDSNNRFVLDYVGLKPDKNNAIKIQITRPGGTINDTVNVFYTSTITTDTQYMAPKVANKYTVFNKELQLSLPKGTVLQSTTVRNMTKFYPDNKILFGIADPDKGIVERKNDYGNWIGSPDEGSENAQSFITVSPELTGLFSSTLNTSNFTPISDIYWIHGGVGELGDKGESGYSAGTNGLAPYSLEGNFTQYAAERVLTPSQRGSLTIAYDPSIVDDVGSTITVFRYSDKTNVGKWIPIGGVVDTKGHTITVPFDEFGYYKVMKLSRSYPDITNHPWARNLLNALYSKGIMNPLRASSFGADDQTTRGEFATLLVRGLDIPLNYANQQTFQDVSISTKSDRWTYEAIETAARAGIVTGLSDGYFQPEMPITREQAAVMIARAMNSKLATNDSKLAATLGKSFLDSGSIEFYARPAVLAITKAKIMEGSPVTVPGATKAQYQFNPKGNMTRAEAAKIAVELLKKSTKLFPKNLS